MKAIGTWKGGYQTRLEDGRGHSLTVDLPPDEGGRDLGTSGLELLVVSLAGCITTIFAVVAKKRKLNFEAMSIGLEAKRPGGSATVTSVAGTLHLVTAASMEEVQTALEITLRTCPVGVVFERAKIPVHVHAIVTPPVTAQLEEVLLNRS
ncbi:MAG: OsmC family protein [Thermoplasmata archaeon]